jgi:hypothetical protein
MSSKEAEQEVILEALISKSTLKAYASILND